MKLNNKGFTFVEILAVIVIIGLLTGISIAAFSRYKENAIKSDYEALAKSSYNAMEEYMMSHPYDDKVSLETLENENLLSNRKDPASKDSDCTGTVEVKKNAGTNGKIDDGEYKVNLCCVSIQKTYTYPGGKSTDLDDSSKCEYVPEDEPVVPPTPGTKYTLKYNDNGGTGCSSKSITKNAGEAWGSLCIPTRSGYTFSGWKRGSETVTASSIANGNITVTAEWTSNTTPTYTVTLNNNGATTSGTGSVKVQVGNTKLPSITNPKKVVTIKYTNNVGATVTGGDKTKTYTLNGWYTAKSSGSKVASNASTPVLQKNVSGYTNSSGKWTKKSNATLYAQWASVTATLPKITKTGYTCKWTTVDGGTTVERASGGSWTFTSANSRTFTAKCTVNSYTCAAGKYLPKNKTSCATCTSGNYCPGGKYKFSTTIDQGLNKCPTGYGNSNAGSSKDTQCYMNVAAGKYVKNKKDTNQSSCGIGTYKEEHKVYYNSTSSCSNCPTGYRDGVGTTAQTNCIMSVVANKYVKSAKDSSATACAAGYISSAHKVYYGKVSTCNLDTKPSGSVKTPSIFYLEYRDSECNTNHTRYSTTEFKNYPYRRYFIHSYLCECQLNSGGRYIGNYKNGTPAPDERDIHPDDDMTIYYDKNNYGIKACKNSSGYYVNQYITNICSEHFQNGLVEKVGNTNYRVGNIHGYRWYDKGPGAGAAYHNFITSGKGWFHSDGRYDNRYVPSDTPKYNSIKQRKEACDHVCSFY